MARRTALLAAALLVAACSRLPVPPTPSPEPPPRLGVSNQTALAVTLVVDGRAVATVAPRTDARVDPAALPPLPWSVEARAPGGRVLSSLRVLPGDVWETSTPGGGGAMKGDAVRVDLSCGRLDVFAGPPLAGPAPGRGTSGDCDP